MLLTYRIPTDPTKHDVAFLFAEGLDTLLLYEALTHTRCVQLDPDI